MEKQIKYFNSDHVASITICNKFETDKVQWCEEYKMKIFFNLITLESNPEGFFRRDSWSDRNVEYSIEDLREGVIDDIKFIVENKKVYRRPKVIVTYINNESREVEFADYEEALGYGHEMIDLYMPNRHKEIIYD